MKNYQYILLDLDGTITDPMVGITKSVEHALGYFNIKVANLRELCPFIGPPLKDSFKEFYHFSEEEAEIALQKYRERFAETGIFENRLYEGITDFLEKADQKGLTLMLATSKPAVFAERILKHFNIYDKFAFIGGSELNGSRTHKADVIRHVLHSNNISSLQNVVMVGDRKYDIIGAKETGIDSIGVLYGYGSRDELSSAGANYIVENITQLEELLNIS